MRYISEEDLRKYIIKDDVDEGCGYIDERDIPNMEWIEDDVFISVSVIEDIKAEIEVEKGNRVYKDQFDLHFNKGLNKALEIIDKHISAE